MKYLALIPARGGSKGIPLKNIKLLAGKPLINYSVDAALGADEIIKVIISSDSHQIYEVYQSYYALNDRVDFHWRSEETASDTASTESAMLEFAASGRSFENIILIQATSPLLKSEDLKLGIKKYETTKAGGVISVVRQKRFFWGENGDSSISPLNYNPKNRQRRQDFQGDLVENGAFYITSRDLLLASKCRISPPYQLQEMSEDSYFEIDSPEDWTIVENLLKGHKRRIADFSKIKILLTDVDGVLTDAGMIYDSDGAESKRFNTRDGKAFELLKGRDIYTGIVTAEETSMVAWRAKKIKADFLYQGISNKLKVVTELLESLNLGFENLAYIGDDINDIDVLSKSGVSACPADAEEAVKSIVQFTMNRNGGEGVVRELVNMILANH
jgi:YrbI family 3-deoxy-D-manno-octulosonate 8-phosphate phosphatase